MEIVAKFFLDFGFTRRAGTACAPRCRGPEADLGTLSSFKAKSKLSARLGGRSGSTAPKVTKTRFSHRGSGAARGCFDSAQTPGARLTRRGQAKKRKKKEA